MSKHQKINNLNDKVRKFKRSVLLFSVCILNLCYSNVLLAMDHMFQKPHVVVFNRCETHISPTIPAVAQLIKKGAKVTYVVSKSQTENKIGQNAIKKLRQLEVEVKFYENEFRRIGKILKTDNWQQNWQIDGKNILRNGHEITSRFVP